MEGIRACRANLAQASKELKAESEKLCRRMEKLKITEQVLSNELADLTEKKRHIQQDGTKKTELKMKADRELFQLKFSTFSKVKQEASDDGSSLKNNKNGKKIKKREKSVAKLKKKLTKIGREERDLDERIQMT